MKNVKIHILDGNPALTSQAQAIKKTAAEIIKKISKLIPITNIDIILMHSPGNISFGIISGQSEHQHKINIALNVTHKYFKKNLRSELAKTLAHELFHSARNQKIGYPKNLIEDMIDEGLAIHFETEVTGNQPQPHYRYSKGNSLNILVKKAKKHFFSRQYDYDEWFHGSKKRNIPRFTGYIIGYNLIKKYLTAHPNTPPSKLIGKKSKPSAPTINTLF
ncbi:MAG: DUF2268 domain-containing putative Zn-dependent protease [Patescibacteria group bacterium]|jgi:uncharacterized protein YjaZ